jgi:DNA repair protein RadA/Sms
MSPEKAPWFRCAACGWSAPRQYVHCQSCGAGPGAMRPTDDDRSGAPRDPVDNAVDIPRLADVAGEAGPRHPTGLAPIDQALAGGFAPGQVILLAGEPGAGKTTLALLAAEHGAGDQALYVTAEETLEQVKARYLRLGVARVRVAYELDPVRIEELAHRGARQLLIVDSLNQLQDPAVSARPGSPSQLKAAATIFVRWAKATGVPVVLLGHLTWEDHLQGPRTIEYLVDTVWYYDRTDDADVRMLEVRKCRFAGARRVTIAREDLEG